MKYYAPMISNARNETYTSITKRKRKQVYIPDTLLTVAGIQEGVYLEVTIRKLKVS